MQITVDDHVMNNEEKVVSNRAPPPVPRRRNPHPPSSSVREISIRDLEPTGPPDRTYKVVFAGDAAVGKTSFINRLTKGHFVSNLASTLGVDFQVKTIRVDERNIAIQGCAKIKDVQILTHSDGFGTDVKRMKQWRVVTF